MTLGDAVVHAKRDSAALAEVQPVTELEPVAAELVESDDQ